MLFCLDKDFFFKKAKIYHILCTTLETHHDIQGLDMYLVCTYFEYSKFPKIKSMFVQLKNDQKLAMFQVN